MDGTTIADLLAALRAKRPLLHHITNGVTINDCANITLCIGAAPVMTAAPEEAAEMAAAADALVLNIGTLDSVQIEAMLLAGARANDRGIPVVLDPVGAGATRLRTRSVQLLLERLEIAVLKGNAGEIGVVAGSGGHVRGVDSGGVTGDPVAVARDYARESGIVVAMTGPTDIVTDGRRVLQVENGDPMLGRLSGTGCMASSVVGAFATVADDRVLSSAAGLAAFGRAAERAARRSNGPYSFRTALFDEVYLLAPSDLAEHARVRSEDGI